MIVLFTLSESVHALKIAQKYDLVTNHMYRQLHINHVFLTQYLSGCNGSFQHVRLSDTLKWLIYSDSGGWWCILCYFCY